MELEEKDVESFLKSNFRRERAELTIDRQGELKVRQSCHEAKFE